MFNKNLVAKPNGTLRVAELARQADVTPATVRYYARIGLLSPEREPENGYRCFSASDLRRLGFIRKAQALGLTIRDIKTILRTLNQSEVLSDQAKSLVEKRLVIIQDRIADLQAIETRAIEALDLWGHMNEPK